MKYFIYLAIAALVIWSVWYLVRHLRRQAKGDCGCGCDGCKENCGKRQ